MLFYDRVAIASLSICGWPQNAQRDAAIGISLRHSGHFLLVGSAGVSCFLMRSSRVFMGSTTKKYTTVAIIRNDTSALRKSPTANRLPLMVKKMPANSGVLITAPTRGVMRSFTNELTMFENAAPIITPTAKSTTFPRRINFVNPLMVGSIAPRRCI